MRPAGTGSVCREAAGTSRSLEKGVMAVLRLGADGPDVGGRARVLGEVGELLANPARRLFAVLRVWMKTWGKNKEGK